MILPVLTWWLLIQVLGWLALPISMRLFRWLPDRGYTFSKALGLLLTSYTLWLGASAGFLSNDLGGILASILIVGSVAAWLHFRRKSEDQGSDLYDFLRQNKRLVWTVEILFLAAFFAWVGLRAYATFKIDQAGGEKFMEIAFLNAILRSKSFPPNDPWLSGFAISYYYFGYVMMALMTRLGGTPSSVGFELYDALLFALTILGAFGVVYNLVMVKRGRAIGSSITPALAAGALGSLLTALMGNLHGVWEALHARGVLPNRFWEWLAIPDLVNAPVTGRWYPGINAWPGGWWWRGSRVLNEVNLLGQSLGPAIDEFPFFSFLLGDNHPHVLALPFVLLAIGLALNLLLRQLTQNKDALTAANDPATDEGGKPAKPWWNPVGLALDNDWGLFLLSGLIIGALGFLNTWDMPIYWGVALLAYGLGGAMAQGRIGRELLIQTASLGAGLAAASGLFYIFFYMSFDSQASGILPYIFPPTRLPQYLTMFGVFIFVIICFSGAYLAWQAKRQEGLLRLAARWWLQFVLLGTTAFLAILLLVGIAALIRPELQDSAFLKPAIGDLSLAEVLQVSLTARLRNPWLFLLTTAILAVALTNVVSLIKEANLGREENSLPSAESSVKALEGGADLFAFLLIFSGLALTLVVEFIYLRDIFGVRMNTVFKFYYQGWVMMACASAYGIWWLLQHLSHPVGRAAFAAGAALLISAGMLYTIMGIHSRADGFQSEPNLDGASVIARNHPDDWAAIEWLNANALPNSDGSVPVIIEAPGDSYSYEGRISAFTGYPTVLGWAVHEYQWRGSYEEQAKRELDILTIYTTSDGQLMLDLLRKYQVRYLILGAPEMNYFRTNCTPERHCNFNLSLRKFGLLLKPVFNAGGTTIYEVP